MRLLDIRTYSDGAVRRQQGGFIVVLPMRWGNRAVGCGRIVWRLSAERSSVGLMRQEGLSSTASAHCIKIPKTNGAHAEVIGDINITSHPHHLKALCHAATTPTRSQSCYNNRVRMGNLSCYFKGPPDHLHKSAARLRNTTRLDHQSRPQQSNHSLKCRCSSHLSKKIGPRGGGDKALLSCPL